MLKAIKGGYGLSSEDPQFHVCLLKFLNYGNTNHSYLDIGVTDKSRS